MWATLEKNLQRLPQYLIYIVCAIHVIDPCPQILQLDPDATGVSVARFFHWFSPQRQFCAQDDHLRCTQHLRAMMWTRP